MKVHYVDNKLLYQEMVKYINSYNESKERGEDPPRITNYIGSCVFQIANRLATTRSFTGYTYKDEMIGDAIENCIRYLHNFNPEKSNNPFAYFTQIIYYAFLRRIDKEKKQTYIKHKTLENSIMSNTLVDLAPEDESFFQALTVNIDYDKISKLMERFDKPPISKKHQKPEGVEKFIEDEINVSE